jgi:hypothetical protein
MTTTVKAFNDLMDQFLTELNLTFPENKAIIKFQASFEVVRAASPSKVLDEYMKAIKPFKNKIMHKDDTFITDDSKQIPALADIDLSSMWTDCSETTRGAIWQYLHTLLVFGTTIKTFPPDTMSMIETMAAKCAEQMAQKGEDGEDGGFSIMDLMKTLNNIK